MGAKLFKPNDAVIVIVPVLDRDNNVIMDTGKLGKVIDVEERAGHEVLFVEDRPGHAVLGPSECFKSLAQETGEHDFVALAAEIGQLLVEKNQAYGSSFAKVGEFFKLLYPNGLRPEQYADALLMARIFDKMMRLATNAGAFGESPYRDLAGYAILGALMHEVKR
jgi:hypothetical protein